MIREHNMLRVVGNDDGSYTSTCTCGASWTGLGRADDEDIESRKRAAWEPLANHVYELYVRPALAADRCQFVYPASKSVCGALRDAHPFQHAFVPGHD